MLEPRSHAYLVFEVTQRCNHGCPHCYNVWKNDTPYPPGELSTAQTLEMLGKVLDESQARLVTLTGGEPLLRKDIFEIIDFLAGRKRSINLICNGSRLKPHTIQRLRGKVSLFELPLLSASRDIHDAMSGRAGAFDDVTLAIARLKAARQRVVVVFVATTQNVHTFARTLDLAIGLGVDGLMLNRFNPGGEGARHTHDLQADPQALMEALEVAEAAAAARRISISCGIAMPPCLIDLKRFPHLSFGFCAAGLERAYYTLDPVGNLRPCNHSLTVLGNVRERGFFELLDSPALKDFVQARPAFCAGCAEEDRCLGGCKAAAEVCFGSLTMADPFVARFSAQAVKVPRSPVTG